MLSSQSKEASVEPPFKMDVIMELSEVSLALSTSRDFVLRYRICERNATQSAGYRTVHVQWKLVLVRRIRVQCLS